MPFAAFQCLLSAGFRLRAREQMLAINAATFPHLDEKGRQKVADSLEKQGETPAVEEAQSTGGDIGALRAYATLEARMHPMRPTKPPQRTEED